MYSYLLYLFLSFVIGGAGLLWHIATISLLAGDKMRCSENTIWDT